MRLTESRLRKIIRRVIIETQDDEERVYDDTVLPGEEADDELLAEPDLTDQEERDEYMQSKQDVSAKKKKARLRSQEETDEYMAGDEHAIVGHIGPLGASGNGPGNKPYGKRKKLKPKDAMSISKALDEYDE